MQILPNIEEPSFLQQLKFEINSWLGRNFKKSRSKILPNRSPLLLDLGVGSNYTEGWVHVDFFVIRWNFWKKQPPARKPDVETDFRYPLNCPDNVVDGVYSSHTLEHLYPRHAYNFLGEIWRILKPKGWLRIAVPDLKRAVDFYNGKISIPEYKLRAEGIAHLTQNFGHHSVWDEELLTYALETIGFINIRKVEFGKEGSDPRLIKEQEVRKHETLVMEAQKP